MRDYKLSFLAGEEKTINVMGNCLHYVKGESALNFAFDGSANSSKFDREVGATLRFQNGYAKVTIKSVVAQNVTISLGMGESYSSGGSDFAGANFVQNTPNNIVSFDDIELAPQQSTLITAANPNNKEVIITLSADAPSEVRIGEQGVNGNKGIVLFAGSTIFLNTKAAVYAYNTDATNSAFIGGTVSREV